MTGGIIIGIGYLIDIADGSIMTAQKQQFAISPAIAFESVDRISGTNLGSHLMLVKIDSWDCGSR